MSVHSEADLASGIQLINNFIQSGLVPTDQDLRDAAAGLPDGYAISFAIAADVGIGPILDVEGTKTYIYENNGNVTGLSSVAAGASLDFVPVEGVIELGISYLGDEGATALEDFAFTAEAAFGEGIGFTISGANASQYLHDAAASINSGDPAVFVSLLNDLPVGSTAFVLAGYQASTGLEVSFTVLDDRLVLEFFGDPNFQGPQTFGGEHYKAALQYVENGHGQATASWTFSDETGEYKITQVIVGIKSDGHGGVIAGIRTVIVGPDGEKLSGAELQEYGFSHLTDIVLIENGGFHPLDNPLTECFASGTLIDMWPLSSSLKFDPDGIYDEAAVRAQIWQKPIEDIIAGDLVVAFDDNGNLVPGSVPRTMNNDVKIILNFFGTRVTPGHVYYRADSKRLHKFETLIDVLRDDGVIQKQDGTLIRAATNAPVGDPRDGFVKAITGTRQADGSVSIKSEGRIRLGTRFIIDGKRTYAVADLIEAGGGVVGDDELIRVGNSAPMPFHWEFGDTLPKPEDFVLDCSGTTLTEIYEAGDWENQAPRLPAPVVLDGGPVLPLSGLELTSMPRNEPSELDFHSKKGEGTINPEKPKLNLSSVKCFYDED